LELIVTVESVNEPSNEQRIDRSNIIEHATVIADQQLITVIAGCQSLPVK